MPGPVVRLFTGARGDRAMTLSEHDERYGRLPRWPEGSLIGAVAESGLRGRGGADFPTAIKMRSVTESRPRAVVVANGAEGEPASRKDKLLLESLPHLVLDGATLAAEAIGAHDVVVCVAAAATRAREALTAALNERSRARVDGVRVRLVTVPNRYLAGEESALCHWLNGGPSKPTFIPPRPFERGVGGQPTLMQNVETLAHIAQIARFGADWFRHVGTKADPGTSLVTVAGAVASPGVYEIEGGTPLRDLVIGAGGSTAPLQAFLIGGYFGSWFDAATALELRLGHTPLRTAGGSLGSGVVLALPESACGLAESARVLRYLARESSGQCGPCTHGLDAIASALAELASGYAPVGVSARLAHWADDVAGRGACHHPDGAVRFLRSALSVFAGEVAWHERDGACAESAHAGTLPVPIEAAAWHA